MESLKRAINARNVVLVVGTGVSSATTLSEPTANWVGLIESGRDRITRLQPELGEEWSQLVSNQLTFAIKHEDTDALVQAASIVGTKFENLGPQATADWLQDDIGNLSVRDARAATALLNLPFPIVTTNYDSLLETVGTRASACWTAPQSIQQVLAGTSNAIGHLHGVWSEPGSVVLTAAHYAKLMDSEAAQHLQKAASSIKSLVYVGFGEGLADPNFASLLKWHRNAFAPSGIDHFRLCRSGDVDALTALHGTDHIHVIPYGDTYADLPLFLEKLAPPRGAVQLTKAGIARDVIAEAQLLLAEDIRSELVIAETTDTTLDLEQVILPPILLPVPHADYVKARSSRSASKRIERLDPVSETQGADVVLLVSEEGAGLTTAIKWMAWKASVNMGGAAPLYVNFRSCRNLRGSLEQQVRIAASTAGIVNGKTSPLPPFVLALDDFAPYVPRITEDVVGSLAANAAIFTVIGCRLGQEDDLLEQFEAAGIHPLVRYLGRLNSNDITALAKVATPTRYEEISRAVIDILNGERLPRTPFTASLLISILMRGGTLAVSASQTAVLEEYVSLLLGRGDPHEDARFSIDQAGRELLLSNLAEHFIENSVASVSEAEAIALFDSIFRKFGWTESPGLMLTNFIERRVLRRSGTSVTFSRTSFFYLFAAKRARAEPVFRDKLVERPLYYSAVLMPYAALARNDIELLSRVGELLEGATSSAAGKGSPFQELALVEPPPPGSDGPFDGLARQEDSQSESASFDHLVEISDNEEMTLFRVIEYDLPPALRLMNALELVSTVLRDSDQVADLNLKQDILVRTLESWGALVAVLSSDRAFQDLIERIASELEDSGASPADLSDRSAFMDEIARTLPASFALGGIGVTLASRKLLAVLSLALDAGQLNESEERTIGAAFLILALSEPGWPAKLRKLLSKSGNIWIVRNFVMWLCVSALSEGHVSKQDEDDLVEICVEIVDRGTRYNTQAERVRNLDSTRQAIRRLRLSAPRQSEPGLKGP